MNVVQAAPNPSAVYCIEQGYEYKINTDSQGNQDGVCIVNGAEIIAWEFYEPPK